MGDEVVVDRALASTVTGKPVLGRWWSQALVVFQRLVRQLADDCACFSVLRGHGGIWVKKPCQASIYRMHSGLVTYGIEGGTCTCSWHFAVHQSAMNIRHAVLPT